jgi:hypothetical protein
MALVRRGFIPLLAQTHGLADAVAEVIELRAARHTRPLHLDLGDLR